MCPSRDLDGEGTITSAPTKLMISGAAVNGESYNGAFVGPTLRFEPGDQIRLTLVNQLPQMTNIHFHGFHVSSPSGMSDNVLRHVAVGEMASYVIDVPATHDQGLFWSSTRFTSTSTTSRSSRWAGRPTTPRASLTR